MPILLQHRRQSIHSVAGVNKDDALPDSHHVQNLGQTRLLLFGARGAVEHLPDLVVEDEAALHLDL
jgi:hypothetical protein